MRKLIKQALLPPATSRKIAYASAAVSAISLAYHGFNFGLGPTLLLVIDWYDQGLSIISGWAKPYIESALVWVFDRPIILEPHWKHIFVLLGLYFFSGVRIEYSDSKGFSATFFVRLLLGFFVALAFSIWIGIVPSARSETLANFAIAAIPLLATSFNDIALRAYRATFTRANEAQRLNQSMPPTWWDYFGVVLRGVLVRTLVGFVIIYGGLQIPLIRQLASPGLALLGLIVVSLALHQIYLGAKELKQLHLDSETWEETALRSRGMLIGLSIFGVLIWACVVIGLDVGKQLLFPIVVR